MISMEAAREDGRSKLRTRFSQNPYGEKLPNLYQSSASSALSSAPQRIAEKIVVRCSGSLRVVFQQVSSAWVPSWNHAV